MRTAGNRCIDLAETRLDLRAVRFGDWPNNGFVPADCLPASAYLLVSDVSIASARSDGLRDEPNGNIEQAL
jgi:hypothetical protein